MYVCVSMCAREHVCVSGRACVHLPNCGKSGEIRTVTQILGHAWQTPGNYLSPRLPFLVCGVGREREERERARRTDVEINVYNTQS